MMTRRRWVWLSTLLVVVVTGAAAAVLIVRHAGSHPPSDCPTVREMIAYNTIQRERFAGAFHPDQGRQPDVAEYRAWAERMRAYSTQIHGPEMASHATALADEADQLVGLVQQARADSARPADPGAPPPWAQPYADLSRQFRDNLMALDRACPAP